VFFSTVLNWCLAKCVSVCHIVSLNCCQAHHWQHAVCLARLMSSATASWTLLTRATTKRSMNYWTTSRIWLQPIRLWLWSTTCWWRSIERCLFVWNVHSRPKDATSTSSPQLIGSVFIASCKWFADFSLNKKASIRWQDSARRQFQAGLRGDIGLLIDGYFESPFPTARLL